MSESEEEFDEQELLQAEQLARALEGRSAHGVPDDALEAAAFLVTANDQGLDEARSEELLQQLLAAAKPREAASRKTLRGGFIWAMFGLASCAGAFWFFSVQPEEAALSATLPEPSLELLQAQAARFQGDDSTDYQQEISEYRGEVLAVLRRGEGKRW